MPYRVAPPPIAAKPVAPLSPAAGEPIPESPDLIGSWAVQRLVDAGIGSASLETLLTAPSRDTAAGSKARSAPPPFSAAPSRPGRAGGARRRPPVVDVLPALPRQQRAGARAKLRAKARHVSGDALHALIDEVCDLVALRSSRGHRLCHPGP